MSYRRIGFLLLTGLILWTGSQVSIGLNSTPVDGVRATALSTLELPRPPQPAGAPIFYSPPITGTYDGPPPPPASTSRYVVTTNLAAVFSAGCTQGLAGEGGLVLLDFGYPYYNELTQEYGAKLLSPNHPFVGGLDVESLVWQFIEGWVACAPGDQTLRVSLALNNSGSKWPGAKAEDWATHGRQWASYVSDLTTIVNQNANTVGRIRIDGAMDIEFPRNTKSNTRAWVDGFDPGPESDFINFGSCDSCPWSQHPNWSPANGWTIEDIYYVSSRVSPSGSLSWAFPEIYATNGEHSDQWYRISLYGATTYGRPLFFRGVLTQYYACQDNNNWQSCANAGTINTPTQGWTQLWQALEGDSLTSMGGPIESSDIRWDRTRVR